MASEAAKIYLSNFIEPRHIPAVFSQADLAHITSCLSHTEEKLSSARDMWGNWDFPYTEHDFSIPYLDYYVLDRIREAGIKKIGGWGDAPFAICITHDVDFVSEGSSQHYRLRAAKNFFKGH